MADVKKIDPFDVEALEKSLNDSATRVSTIWVSFLIFSLYLLTAATTVTDRQLLLAEPVKLPVLNIDLPLWGFFVLAPILFVILHIYVLLQVLLLSRTATAYNESVDRVVRAPPANATMRQRLANTLFSQIFAGSPRERGGLIGGLLQSIVWVTLAAAPVLILMAFQFSFLAYHSHIATWTHRILIFVEMGAFFVIWPMTVDSRKDFSWRGAKRGAVRALAYPYTLAIFLLWPLVHRRWGFDWPRHQPTRGSPRHRRRHAASVLVYSAIALISMSLATFPGEPHLNLATLQPISAVQCERWIHRNLGRLDLRIDRLILPKIDVVDDEKFNRSEATITASGESQFQGERTKAFRGRDLNCGDFSEYADLRLVDFTGAHLRMANFNKAKLQGAVFDDAELRDASFTRANLRQTSFARAQLNDAQLYAADISGSNLDNAVLKGAWLDNSQARGASFKSAQLQGSHLDNSLLQGAYLAQAMLQGASLEFAQLDGAFLDAAKLQGTSLSGSSLRGVSFNSVFLQGAILTNTNFQYAIAFKPRVWSANIELCQHAYVSQPNFNKTIDTELRQDDSKSRRWSLVDIPLADLNNYIDRMIFGIGNSQQATLTRVILENRLKSDLTKAYPSTESWILCESWHDGYDLLHHTAFLRDLVCNAEEGRKELADGIIRNWTQESEEGPRFAAELARRLLSEDCAAVKFFSEQTKIRLRQIIANATK